MTLPNNTGHHPIALAMTGASGACYGLRLLECLLAAGREVYLMLSKAAQIVIDQETDLNLPGRARGIEQVLGERFGAQSGQLRAFGREDWNAPVASGSAPMEAMIICPCSTGTLAAVAHGMSDNLIERAADVTLKERRTLVLVVRETPFSTLHLQNMLQLSQQGARILPANPGFYHRPTQINQLVDFIVARVLDQIGIDQRLMPRWGID